MIDFIYIAVLFVYVLLVMAYFLENIIIGLLASMGIIITGVYLLVYGAGDISNLLTLALGSINVGLGAYILIAGSLREIERY